MPDRPSSLEIWRNERCDQADRLLAFEAWVAEQLATKLKWPSDPAKAKRQVLQCRSYILQAVADMGRHGFLFRPRELAQMVRETLDDIAARQARGEIKDLFPYLKITWQSYTRMQADQLRDRALSLGSHISNATAHVATIPQLAYEDHCESIRDRKRHARKAAKKTAKLSDLPLFDSLDS